MTSKNWHKAISQYLYLASTLLVQVASILILPRVLGAEKFAIVAYAQAFAIWMALLVEYGFSFSATRAMAKTQQDIAPITNKVRAANFVLAALALLIAPLIAGQLPLLQGHTGIILLAVLLAVGQGLTPWWYFQGREQVYRLVNWELAAAVLTIVAWLIIAPTQPSVSSILLIQLLARCVVMAAGQWLVWHDVPYRKVSFREIWGELQQGVSMFIFLVSTALYTTMNILLLGFYVDARSIAIFASAEKLLRFAIRGWEPLNRFFYPHSVRLMHQHDYLPFVRKLFWSYSLMSLTLAGALFLLRDWLVPFVLGKDFEDSIAVFGVLTLAIPMIAMSNVLGILYLLPAGRDGLFNSVIMSGGAVHMAVALVLVHWYGVIGMAFSVVLTESLVTLVMLLIAYRTETRRVLT